MTDRERISRLEALLARVKARTDEPRPENADDAVELQNGTSNGAAHLQAHDEIADEDLVADGDALNGASRADSVFPVESSTLHAMPPPPAISSANAFSARDSAPAFREDKIDKLISRPAAPPPIASPSSPTSLEEAFEQYEMVSEVVEIAPDAEDDSVRPSVPAPIMSDDAFGEADLQPAAPAEEYQSQQRLVVAPSVRPASGVDEGELEVLGEADLSASDLDDSVMEVETDDLLSRTSEVSLMDSHGAPTRDANELIAQILSTGLDAPPENANRPVLELQDDDDEIEEPPPSSRRPVSAETISYEGAREQELTFENDPPPSPLMTPPPESGRQVALPDLSATSLSGAFEAEFSGDRDESRLDDVERSLLRAKLEDNSGVAVIVEPSSTAAASTFGDLIDLALSI